MKSELVWLVAVLVLIALGSSWLSVGGPERPGEKSASPLVSAIPTSTPESSPQPAEAKPEHRSWDKDLNVQGIRSGQPLSDIEAALGPATNPGQAADSAMSSRSWDKLGVSAMFSDGKAMMIQGAQLSQGSVVILKPGHPREKILATLGQPDSTTPVSELKVKGGPDVFHAEGRETDQIWVFRSEPSVVWVRVDANGYLVSVALI